jgi:hypothetical protein
LSEWRQPRRLTSLSALTLGEVLFLGLQERADCLRLGDLVVCGGDAWILETPLR